MLEGADMAEQKVIEKAKAWADKEYDELRYSKCEKKHFVFTFKELREMGKQAFIAGHDAALADGWHNIKDNPQDLPTEDGKYLTVEEQYGEAWYDTTYFITGVNVWGVKKDIIAWHKIPPYERGVYDTK